MKKLAILALPLILSGCFDDLTEQQEFINQVRANTNNNVEPIPEIKNFNHFAYTASEKRSPFVAPKPEVIQDRLLQVQNCLHPDPRRRKEALERFPLENLQMRGTIGSATELLALITAPDNSLHEIGVGERMGLFNGKVTQVQNGFIELLELIPDGAGCWKERLTKVEIVEAGSNASS
ncbi:MAG: pilus assembly protein PilP [Pseudomonadota bacterium]|jgi:type IV pilus assembly protein PilP|uniref:Pilus assembly protein PilP n=1 Tax=Pseudoalteromonas spongiae TaxID=298657 RepID=A0ABU8EUC1_9GAMM|nr:MULTISPECIES: pilus assembly protein PilP [Pseudoalteromonas]ATC99731.1 type IV pilus assembly protein PilP [Pseudoalteromonas spongiae UST010723-006]KPV94141.1 Pilus assembly protein, PilP [Pseudoalteromonas sp. P1-9]MEC8324664.1 pilus assembly protein PilP [Pseudomonadota bacterium]